MKARDPWQEIRIILRDGDAADLESFERRFDAMQIDDRSASAIRALLRWMRGDALVAQAMLNRTAERRSLGRQELLVRGLIGLERGQTEQARSDFERAEKMGLRDPRLSCGLAGLALMDGEPERAIAHLERSLSIDPEYWQTHHLLGLAASALGNTDEAIARFTWVARKMPDVEAPWIQLAHAFVDAKRFDAAVETLAPVVRAHPRWHRLGLALADASHECGMVAAAIAVLAPIARRTNDVELMRVLAQWLSAAGDVESAMLVLEVTDTIADARKRAPIAESRAQAS